MTQLVPVAADISRSYWIFLGSPTGCLCSLATSWVESYYSPRHSEFRLPSDDTCTATRLHTTPCTSYSNFFVFSTTIDRIPRILSEFSTHIIIQSLFVDFNVQVCHSGDDSSAVYALVNHLSLFDRIWGTITIVNFIWSSLLQ
jgi:hypothetical protein